MILSLATAPAAEPLDATACKTHMRVTTSADDTYIGTLITAARRAVEQWTNRSIISQTWDLYLDAWPDDTIWLPMPPVSSVTGVYYTIAAGTESTLSSAYYDTDMVSEPGRIMLGYGDSWPSDSLRPLRPIRVRYIAGYGASGASVPGDILHAIKALVAQYYEHREPVIVGQTVAMMPELLRALLAPYVVHMRGDQT